MDRQIRDAKRAMTPVVGVALLIGLVVLLSATVGVFAIEIAQSEPDTDFLEGESESESESVTPDIDWEIERSGSFVTITHAGGESIDASSVAIVVDGDEIDGYDGTIKEGDSTMEYSGSEVTVEVVWVGGDGDDLVLERATV